MNGYINDSVAVVGALAPVTVVNVAAYSTVVDMSTLDSVMFVFMLGNIAAETVDYEIQYCDSDGSNPGTLKAGTQIAAHASNNDSKMFVLQAHADALLSISQTARYMRAKIITGDAVGGPAAVLALGKAKHMPATNAAAVVAVTNYK